MYTSGPMVNGYYGGPPSDPHGQRRNSDDPYLRAREEPAYDRRNQPYSKRLDSDPHLRDSHSNYSTRLPKREDTYARVPPREEREMNGYQTAGRPRSDPGHNAPAQQQDIYPAWDIEASTTDHVVDLPVFDLDHLATFTVGQKRVSSDQGIERLKQMEMSTGIWTMRCKMIIQPRDLVIVDKQTEDEMERFPLDSVVEPVARMDRRDVYNNIILFTVLGDKQMATESEMHIFQCISKSANEVVDEIKSAKSGKTKGRAAGPSPDPPRRQVPEFDSAAAARSAQATQQYSPPAYQPSKAFRQAMNRDDAESELSDRTDRDVQLLNHCFDDIERFALRLQHAADAYMELEKRLKKRDKKHKKPAMGDGMLTVRARPPQAKEFIDTFQKFKLAFNILARLKPHIHDPNAPELVHFMFTPLSLIVDASKDPYRGTPDLAAKVVSPLLTHDARDLLENCLTSREMDLWRSLGDAWTVTRDEWTSYVPPYYPRFSNGWQPSPNTVDDIAYASSSADLYRQPQPGGGSRSGPPPNMRDHRDYEQAVPRGRDYDRHGSSRRDHQDMRNEQEEMDSIRREQERLLRERNRPESPYRRIEDPPHMKSSGEPVRRDGPQRDLSPSRRPASPYREPPQHRGSQRPMNGREDYNSAPRRGGDSFLDELRRRGTKACVVQHDRMGNNARELSVAKGEVLEVLDDSKKWWKLRNEHGESGHAPFTILKERRSSKQNDSHSNPASVNQYLGEELHYCEIPSDYGPCSHQPTNHLPDMTMMTVGTL